MNTTIQSLAEEATRSIMRGLFSSVTPLNDEVLKPILTSLAEKASQNGLQPLPEEMPEWFLKGHLIEFRLRNWAIIRQHFGTKPAEWWHGLKKGDKFVDENGITRIFSGDFYLHPEEGGLRNSAKCSPYTPTAIEQFMETLSPEQMELLKAKGLKIEEVNG